MSSEKKSPETTDWLSDAEQQVWFNRFKSGNELGINFVQFHEFLKATIYTYFVRFPLRGKQFTGDEIKQDETSKFTYQQEMQLFNMFDSKNDHIIDRDEFAHMCQSWLEKIYHRACALVVVDVQNDFIDGSLALVNGSAMQDGAEVVPVINKILDKCSFDVVAYTQDWHPSDHIGFYDNLHLRKYFAKPMDSATKMQSGQRYENDIIKEEATSDIADTEDDDNITSRCFKLKRLDTNVRLFETVLFGEGRIEQKLWPVHCVQNSWGAELHPKLKLVPNSIRVYKGTLSHVDAYSAFWDNMRLNETGLRQELISRKINDLYFCGLALDYCVAASAIDAAKAGFMTFVIEDACRALDEQETTRRKEEMMKCGIFIIDSRTVKNLLSTGTYNNNESKDIMNMYSSDDRNNNNEESVFVSGFESSSTGALTAKVSYSEKFDRMLVMDICFKRALTSIQRDVS